MSESFATRLRQVVRANRAVIVPKTWLVGDTPGLVRALHALSEAGLLEPNIYAADAGARPCPRCGGLTVVWRNNPPSVCTGCRVERLVLGCDESGWQAAAFAAACRSWGPATEPRPGEVAVADCLHCGQPVAARVKGRDHVVVHLPVGSRRQS